MAARTVLSTTQTGVTSYSSGSLAVGDLTELALDIIATTASRGTTDVNGYYSYELQISRVDALGNPCLLVESVPMLFSDYGAGAPVTGAFSKSYGVAANQWSFGDHIQAILLSPNGITVDFTLSIIGK